MLLVPLDHPEANTMPKSITDTQQFTMSVPVTRKGQPATLQGVSWTSSDPAVLTVTPDPADNLKATAKAVTPGVVVITFKGDKDPGDGVVEEIRTADVVVGAGLATVGEILIGEVTEQPAGSPGTTGAVIPA